MRKRSPFNLLLVAAAALPLLLVIADFVLIEGNRGLQAEVNRRQRLVNEGTQLARLNGLLVRHIAVAAVTSHDERLRELLGRSGDHDQHRV
ncbi:MAG TPA: hypothetical protein VHU15_05425 [Stellaceae bacterium]|jgi:hypothetical protein|nr:hypothetical protein [Stellaceae bacterium]